MKNIKVLALTLALGVGGALYATINSSYAQTAAPQDKAESCCTVGSQSCCHGSGSCCAMHKR